MAESKKIDYTRRVPCRPRNQFGQNVMCPGYEREKTEERQPTPERDIVMELLPSYVPNPELEDIKFLSDSIEFQMKHPSMSFLTEDELQYSGDEEEFEEEDENEDVEYAVTMKVLWPYETVENGGNK